MSEDGMRLWLEILSGARAWESPDGPVTITSRSVWHADHGPAADFLEAQLAGMGLPVTRLEFDRDTDHFINLEARLAGEDPGLDPVFVTAHYDSTASRTEGWYPITDPAPGASDNGSGTVITLEIARLLSLAAAADLPARDVVFVLFDGEELGLFGSERYVADLVDAGGRVLCVMNVDMVGWSPPATPDRYWYTYDAANEPRAAFGLEAIYDFVPEAVPIPSSLELFASSDHASFWDGGFCAASMSGFPPAPEYHTTGDVIGACDWPYLMAAARSAAAAAAAWAYRWVD
jgi:Zn-dependent M28 family amino/carboxypeptidase